MPLPRAWARAATAGVGDEAGPVYAGTPGPAGQMDHVSATGWPRFRPAPPAPASARRRRTAFDAPRAAALTHMSRSGSTRFYTDPMRRLSPHEVESIKRAVAQVAGSAARLSLFGSRVDDNLRGGDIDLLLEPDTPTEHPAWLGAQVEAAILLALGDQKVDVLVAAPNLTDSLVHQAARATGRHL